MGFFTALALGAAAVGGMAAAGAFKKPKKPPPPPEAPPPPPTPEVEEEAIKKFKRKRAGRGKTIITGDLTPELIGKKTLLGD